MMIYRNSKRKEVRSTKINHKPDVVNNSPSQEDLLKYTQEDFNEGLQKAKDELGNDYNVVYLKSSQAKKINYLKGFKEARQGLDGSSGESEANVY
jgi:hypothetical protein